KDENRKHRGRRMNPHPHQRLARQSLWRVFRWPVLLGVSSFVGLVSALLGDGAWDALSWATLFVPVAVVAWFCAARFRRRKTGSPCAAAK
ncbi:MAG: hypothetical protein LBR95_01470, partial [Azoarcus sp.]|nr:hypothetical protein [Azoarcus sp.]